MKISENNGKQILRGKPCEIIGNYFLKTKKYRIIIEIQTSGK